MALFGIEHVIVHEGEIGLLYEDGRFVRALGPGRHRVTGSLWGGSPWYGSLWGGWPWAGRQTVTRVDLRRKLLPINGQEMLTADAISVRLNVTATYRIVDAPRALHEIESYSMALYTAVQLCLRKSVQARTLDELLAAWETLAAENLAAARPDAETLGLELSKIGVRDIILPGDVKRMLSQEVEALRAGCAALIAAREETAATRARANTARLLADHPILLRLRELEALEAVGRGAGNTVVTLLPTDLLQSLRPGSSRA